MARLLKTTLTFGDISIEINTPGLMEFIASVLGKAEKEHPGDIQMQEYEIGNGLRSFLKISELKAELKIGA